MQFEYFSKIKDLLDQVETKEEANINNAIDLMTETILNKKAIYSFGASHAGILTQEMFYRAGGLVLINPIFGKEVELSVSPITLTSKMERCVGYGSIIAERAHFQADDLLIVHSVSGRNPVTIEVAMAAKKKQAKIIGITNLAYSKSVTSRHPSNQLLYEICDIVIDNHGDIGDACISLENLKQKVAPTSTVVGATIVNTIISETCKKLISKGMKTPPIFYSANLDGGDQLNKQIYEEFQKQIHYKF